MRWVGRPTAQVVQVLRWLGRGAALYECVISNMQHLLLVEVKHNRLHETINQRICVLLSVRQIYTQKFVANGLTAKTHE